MAEVPTRRACNRCHAQKLGCKRVGQEPCERCTRLKTECRSSPSLRLRRCQPKTQKRAVLEPQQSYGGSKRTSNQSGTIGCTPQEPKDSGSYVDSHNSSNLFRNMQYGHGYPTRISTNYSSDHINNGTQMPHDDNNYSQSASWDLQASNWSSNLGIGADIWGLSHTLESPGLQGLTNVSSVPPEYQICGQYKEPYSPLTLLSPIQQAAESHRPVELYDFLPTKIHRRGMLQEVLQEVLPTNTGNRKSLISHVSEIHAKLCKLSSTAPMLIGPEAGTDMYMYSNVQQCLPGQGLGFDVDQLFELSRQLNQTVEEASMTINPGLVAAVAVHDAPDNHALDANTSSTLLLAYIKLLELYQALFVSLRVEILSMNSSSLLLRSLSDISAGCFPVASVQSLHISLTVRLAEELLDRVAKSIFSACLSFDASGSHPVLSHPQALLLPSVVPTLRAKAQAYISQMNNEARELRALMQAGIV